MSRRHKEIDRKIPQPQPVEPVADCRQQTTDDSTVQVLEGLKDVLKQPQFSISRKEFWGLLHGFMDRAINEALSEYASKIEVVYKYGDKTPCHSLFGPEQNLQLILREATALQKEAKQALVLEDDNSPPDEEDEPRGRGRPMIKRLCSLFRDEKIWPLAKDIFRKIYHESIQKAVDLTQYLVCFVCSIFRISKTEVIDGRVAHFHRLMKEHFQKKMMPSLRKLQQGVQWLRDKTQTFFRNKKVEKEELLHQTWEALVQLISGHMVELIPQYAI